MSKSKWRKSSLSRYNKAGIDDVKSRLIPGRCYCHLTDCDHERLPDENGNLAPCDCGANPNYFRRYVPEYDDWFVFTGRNINAAYSVGLRNLHDNVELNRQYMDVCPVHGGTPHSRALGCIACHNSKINGKIIVDCPKHGETYGSISHGCWECWNEQRNDFHMEWCDACQKETYHSSMGGCYECSNIGLMDRWCDACGEITRHNGNRCLQCEPMSGRRTKFEMGILHAQQSACSHQCIFWKVCDHKNQLNNGQRICSDYAQMLSGLQYMFGDWWWCGRRLSSIFYEFDHAMQHENYPKLASLHRQYPDVVYTDKWRIVNYDPFEDDHRDLNVLHKQWCFQCHKMEIHIGHRCFNCNYWELPIKPAYFSNDNHCEMHPDSDASYQEQCWECWKESWLGDPPQTMEAFASEHGMTIIPTFLKQDDNTWVNARSAFEQSLMDMNVLWMVYVKFCHGADGNIRPLSACKSGSKLVNKGGSDVNFSYGKSGAAHRLLNETDNLQWYQEYIAVRSFDNERDAYIFEMQLQQDHHLLG